MKLAFSLPNNDNFRPMLNMFIDYVIDNYPKMSISGLSLDDSWDLSQGIQNAGKGAVVVINKDNHYDIDWYPNKERAAKDGVTVDLSLENDFSTIKRFLKAYNAPKSNNTGYRSDSSKHASFINSILNGAESKDVHVNDSYIRVGTRVFMPNRVEQVKATPATTVIRIQRACNYRPTNNMRDMLNSILGL